VLGLAGRDGYVRASDSAAPTAVCTSVPRLMTASGRDETTVPALNTTRDVSASGSTPDPARTFRRRPAVLAVRTSAAAWASSSPATRANVGRPEGNQCSGSPGETARVKPA